MLDGSPERSGVNRSSTPQRWWTLPRSRLWELAVGDGFAFDAGVLLGAAIAALAEVLHRLGYEAIVP